MSYTTSAQSTVAGSIKHTALEVHTSFRLSQHTREETNACRCEPVQGNPLALCFALFPSQLSRRSPRPYVLSGTKMDSACECVAWTACLPTWQMARKTQIERVGGTRQQALVVIAQKSRVQLAHYMTHNPNGAGQLRAGLEGEKTRRSTIGKGDSFFSDS